MNNPDLELNLYDLISCSCWDAVVLHVGMHADPRVKSSSVQERAQLYLHNQC